MDTGTTTRGKLPEKRGTIQVFFSSEVRRDREGKIMRDRNDRVMRGYYGFVHNDTDFSKCDDECREISHQVKFKAEALLKANHAGATLRGDSGEKVKFASRPQRSEREGPRPIVVFMRSSERSERDRPEKTIPAGVRYNK